MTKEDTLFIQGAYNTLYNAVTQPDRKFVVTHYFLDEWVPILGPSLAWLVVTLRQRCFWNRRQDWCIVDKATLAREAALQERTIERSLRKPFSDWFVLQIKHRYRYRNDLGKTVRDKNQYQLLLDEPLAPRHQVGLASLLQQVRSDDADPLTESLNILHQLLDLPDLNDKISYADKANKSLQRRTVLELVAEAYGIDLRHYAADPRLALLDQACSQLHNKIVQPNKVYVGWQYFRLNWLEHLGHALGWLIIYLRRRCFWDAASGELRDEVRLFKKDLARAIGQTSRNLGNLLENSYTSLFFNIQEAGSPDTDVSVRTKGPSTFRVRLVDEPLLPQDQDYIKTELQRQLNGDFFGTDAEQGQLNLFPIIDRASNRQNFAYGQAGEKSPDRKQKESRIGQKGGETMPVREAKESRLGNRQSEILSDRVKPNTASPFSSSEKLSVRDQPDVSNHNPASTFEELLSDRSGQESPTGPIGKEILPDSKPKKSQLVDGEAEKMPQRGDLPDGKNVVSLNDSLNFMEREKIQTQNIPFAAVEQLLDVLDIQEPTRSLLLQDPHLTPIHLKAWKLYADTQPGLNNPASYVIKRVLSHDVPPSEFLAFAELDDVTWITFEHVVQGLHLGRPQYLDLEPEQKQVFIRWCEVFHGLDAGWVRSMLVEDTAVDPRGNHSPAEPAESAPQGQALARQIWRLALSQLQLQMTKSTFDSWFRRTSGLRYDGQTLVVGVQNDYAKDWLENRLLELVERALAGVVGEPVRAEFEVQKDNTAG
jgi:hypothetical protein